MIKLTDVAKNFKGLPHQIKALAALEALLGADGMADTQEWVRAWRSAPQTPQKGSYANTWDGMEQAARDAGAKFPEVVAAQWALESAYGTATSGKNNFFGIKGSGTVKTTLEDYGNGFVTIQAAFRDFASPYECVLFLVTQWYKDYTGYAGVNRAATREDCAYLLKQEGYATDPAYSQKLIKLMKEHD
jgi:flagellum-specific peptidoglycan hydrolase FlgJ